MPHKDKEERKAYNKEYEAKNKEKRKAQRKEHYQKNKERIRAEQKEYRAKNKEMIALRTKKDRANNPDKFRIKKWKDQGIIDGDFPLLHKVFMKETNCWICGVKYSKTRIKCLEHDHSIKDEPNVRYICCNVCNVHVVC